MPKRKYYAAPAYPSVDVTLERVAREFPADVAQFARKVDHTALAPLENENAQTKFEFERLTREGVLVHLAIATNDAVALELLFAFTQTNSDYARDAALSFAMALRCAVLYSRVEMLERIRVLRTDEADWCNDSGLLRLALAREHPDVSILDWLHAHIPHPEQQIHTTDVARHAKQGNVDVVQWLHEHNAALTQRALNQAAYNRHVNAMRYIYTHSTLRCPTEAVVAAVHRRNGDVVECVLEHQRDEMVQQVLHAAADSNWWDLVVALALKTGRDFDMELVIKRAARAGRLDILKLLHDKQVPGFTPEVMDAAAERGHVDILQFLFENRGEGCSSNALDSAVSSGSVETVAFLYERYGLSCSMHAMEIAADRGHLDVLQYLHVNCDVVCSSRAMDCAATRGHLRVVEFLHYNRTEGCSVQALNAAAKNGHYAVAKFLCEHRSEGDVRVALASVKWQSRHASRIAALLEPSLEPGQRAYPMLQAVSKTYHPEIVQLLCDHIKGRTETTLTMERSATQAVAASMTDVLRAVCEFASLEALVDAQTYALEQNDINVAALAAYAIQALPSVKPSAVA